MAPDLEERVAASLRREAGGVAVPTMPDLPEAPGPSRGQVWAVAGAAAAAVVAIVVLVPVLGSGDGESPEPPPATGSTSPITPDATDDPPRSLADLPVGDPPEMAYVLSGSSVVLKNRSIDLEWDVVALTRGTDHVLVYSGAEGGIHRVGRGEVEFLTTQATSAPDPNGWAWIEGTNIVYPQSGETQPLPAGCCADARVVGIDFDMDPDIFVTSREGSWMWDTYEGGEGTENPPPESDDYFWPVGGLGRGTPVATGISSEVLVEYPGDTWGWGYVTGPRIPGSQAPVVYEEQERASVARVWLTSDAIVALEGDGRLVVLGSESRNDLGGHHWRGLTGDRTVFVLPDDLRVDGVVAETRRTVLADMTDRSGTRAWVRCDVGSYACEIAAELGPGDITPQ